MARATNVSINIDKLKVCFNQPRETYNFLHTHYDRENPTNGIKMLDMDGYRLVFIEDDEESMTAFVDIYDGEKFVRLGSFQFNNSQKYAGKAFFTFENSALYSTFSIIKENKSNWLAMLEPIADNLGMTFNNVTEVEVALDANVDFISKIRKYIRDVEHYEMYINGRKVKDDTKIEGYGEFYSRTRERLSKQPTLYFSQAKKTDMEMRIYNKSAELDESSPEKRQRYEQWLGWTHTDKIYRAEVVLHNTNVRDFCTRIADVTPELGEHDAFLGHLNIVSFRGSIFADASDRLVYFKDKETGQKISVVDLLGI